MSRNKSIIDKIPYRSRVKIFNSIVDVAHTVFSGDPKERAHKRKLELQDLKNEGLMLKAEIEKAKADAAQARRR